MAESSVPVAGPPEAIAPEPRPLGLEPIYDPCPAPVEERRVPGTETKAPRLVSLDAYRGFIMLVMASSGLAIPGVVKEMAKNQEVSPLWTFLAFHTDHVAWTGCSFWDLIQPSFMFMVGVALPYSYASRLAKGDSNLKIYAHVLLRSLILIALGVFLSSNWSKMTNFTFVNVLAQIGLGYVFVHLLVNRGKLIQLGALAAILGGYWLYFFLYPLPPADFDYRKVGVPQDWAEHQPGVLAHWDKNTNAAAGFDQWFLNLFPQEPRKNRLTGAQMSEFVYNEGGYQTLNFIPSIATMLLGLMAGEMLRSVSLSSIEKLTRLAFIGIVCFMAGLAMSVSICPNVKRIWTPTWALYSSAFTFWMLAGFYLVIDMLGFKKWSIVLTVVGMNSIAVYCMSQLLKSWFGQSLRIHLGQDIFDRPFGTLYAPIVQSGAVLLVMWLISVWMYRQKIFIRI